MLPEILDILREIIQPYPTLAAQPQTPQQVRFLSRTLTAIAAAVPVITVACVGLAKFLAKQAPWWVGLTEVVIILITIVVIALILRRINHPLDIDEALQRLAWYKMANGLIDESNWFMPLVTDLIRSSAVLTCLGLIPPLIVFCYPAAIVRTTRALEVIHYVGYTGSQRRVAHLIRFLTITLLSFFGAVAALIPPVLARMLSIPR